MLLTDFPPSAAQKEDGEQKLDTNEREIVTVFRKAYSMLEHLRKLQQQGRGHPGR